MWFEQLTGFREISPEQVRQHLAVNGSVLTSLVNGKQFHFGKLEVPTLTELKHVAPPLENISEHKHTVTQAYCSALPVAYSNIESNLWKEFAKLILAATYEATFYAALKNYENTGNNRVYLTLVGGGVFGNAYDWIFDAIRSAVIKFHYTPLDVMIVSYGSSNSSVRQFVESLN